MNPATSKAADNQIEAEIKEWLKFASERDGGKKLREQTKRIKAKKSTKHPDVEPDTDSYNRQRELELPDLC